MLVLTRRNNESITLTINQKKASDSQISIPISIELFDIKSGQVRVGIDAPENVAIMRSELLFLE